MKYLLMMISLVAIGFFATSCSVNPSSTLSVDGQWTGTKDFSVLGNLIVDLDLNELSGVVAGSGEIVIETVATQPTIIPAPIVAGSFDDPDVTIYIIPTKVTFEGKVNSDNTKIIGKLILADIKEYIDIEDQEFDFEFVKK
ncbi:MAG: hypothetical protein PF588_05220 [Candidatus Kapabacteria bacterium]|jgi:hypothetical protein|nr:hypothetical protein [Candidatus Kapabacteria bacterium]